MDRTIIRAMLWRILALPVLKTSSNSWYLIGRRASYSCELTDGVAIISNTNISIFYPSSRKLCKEMVEIWWDVESRLVATRKLDSDSCWKSLIAHILPSISRLWCSNQQIKGSHMLKSANCTEWNHKSQVTKDYSNWLRFNATNLIVPALVYFLL